MDRTANWCSHGGWFTLAQSFNIFKHFALSVIRKGRQTLCSLKLEPSVGQLSEIEPNPLSGIRVVLRFDKCDQCFFSPFKKSSNLAKLLEFTLLKKSKIFTISLSKNGKISPGEEKKNQL
jgi:hypothetical protein